MERTNTYPKVVGNITINKAMETNKVMLIVKQVDSTVEDKINKSWITKLSLQQMYETIN